MSLGRRSQMNGSEPLWIAYEELPKGPGHSFYSRLEEILRRHQLDAFCERLCEPGPVQITGFITWRNVVYFIASTGGNGSLGLAYSDDAVEWKLSSACVYR